ncbi:hypothetical protein ACFZBE_40825 [Streptomyces sp. NPDC008061]|uniref:hypothetical protein n=1 Tax=Streptomyces sp. NPDC008061 TaxID=3364805 RepID=UPI0036E0BC0B
MRPPISASSTATAPMSRCASSTSVAKSWRGLAHAAAQRAAVPVNLLCQGVEDARRLGRSGLERLVARRPGR